MTHPDVDALLEKLRQALKDRLSQQVDRLWLFGSRARGDARVDSDIDVLVVLHGDVDPLECLMRTGDVVAELSLQYDVVISPVFVSKAQFERGGSPFLRNVRREAVPA